MHVGSFWGMNFSGMFLPLSLGKWHRRGLQMELPSFRGYFVQTGQWDWTVHEKKRDLQPHCRASVHRELGNLPQTKSTGRLSLSGHL